MRAAVLKVRNAPEITEFQAPEARNGLRVVEMLMAGLNPKDIVIALGLIPAITPSLPAVVGLEGVGIMDGKRVCFGGAAQPFGSVAEHTLVDPGKAFEVPDHLTNEQAITTGVVASTAWIALSWRAKIKPGEHLLVLGGTGAVGFMAVQAAKRLGAGCVIAAGRNEKVLETLKSLGADATVVLNGDAPSIAAKFTEASGGRINLILDMLWGPAATAALLAASPGARLVSVGFAAATETPFQHSNHVRPSDLDRKGFRWTPCLSRLSAKPTRSSRNMCASGSSSSRPRCIRWRISREPGSDRKSRRTERSLSISSVSEKRITS
jgi:NADPH:quinone reductase-like Zn-dependent oxidoreductase